MFTHCLYHEDWHHLPTFSPVPLAPVCLRAGLLDGVVLNLPLPGKEAVFGQKSSELLSVWVLLSLLPVLAWEALTGNDAVAHDREGRGGGIAGIDEWSWWSFPKSNPKRHKDNYISKIRHGKDLLHHPANPLPQARQFPQELWLVALSRLVLNTISPSIWCPLSSYKNCS